MAGLFDFEKFYTEKSVKTEIHLDLSGIDLKSTASSESGNEDGSADDVSMNEYVTNNVMYKISGIGYANATSLVDVNSTVRINYSSVQGTESSDLVIAEACPVDILVEAGLVRIPESRAPMGPVTLTAGAVAYEASDGASAGPFVNAIYIVSDGKGSPVNDITIAFVPRVRLQNVANVSKAENKPTAGMLMIDPTSPSFSDTNQNPWDLRFGVVDMRRAMGALGMFGERYHGWKWYSRQTKKNWIGVERYDSFKSKLAEIGEILEQNNMGIKVTYYDDSLAEPVRDEDGNVIDEGDWTKTDIPRSSRLKFDDYYTYLNDFVSKCKARGDENPLPDLVGQETVVSEEGTSNTISNVTAVIPNVSDAFKKFYYHADTLAEEFNDKYFATYRSIKSVKGVRSFMSSSLKRKLNNELLRLRKPADTTIPKRYLLDVASCANLLDHLFHNVQRLSMPTYNSASPDFNHGVRMVSDYGWSVKYNLGAEVSNPSMYHIGLYDSASFIPNQSTLTGLFYSTCRYAVQSSTYYDWSISSSKKTVSEIKDMLCDYYTGLYNDLFDKEEGDEGYVRWYYDKDAASGEPYRLTVTYNDADGKSVSTDMSIMAYNPAYDTDAVQDPANIVTAAKNGYTSLPYTGTARAYIEIVMREISSLVSSIDATGVYYFTTLDDSTEIEIVDWDTCSTGGKVISFLDFVPSYETYDNVGDLPNADIDGCIDFAVDVMGEAIDEIDTILNVQGRFLGPAYLLIQKYNLREAKEDYDDLMSCIRKIRWYQAFSGESVFENRSFVGDRSDLPCPYIFMPARFMVPVLMYKKVRVKYKRFFKTRYKMVKRSIGVRWAEVTFIDNDVYSAYPQNTDEPRQFFPIGKPATVYGDTLVFDGDLEGVEEGQLPIGTMTKFKTGEFVLNDADGVEVPVAISGSVSEFTITNSTLADGSNVFVYGLYLPLDSTSKSDDLTPVRIEYRMPSLPFDSEIRRWAFQSYGAFDQDKYASVTREVPAEEDKVDGWKIFKPSSKRIGDMRAQLGIYDAVSILLGILRNAYGVGQVEVVDTVRSIEDQELMCTGGAESAFLSWHNYGLAIKILINDAVTGMPIEDGSDDMKKLIDIAEGFTIACGNGAFGKPLNVVWCGRLKLGANIFDWEFLPIGVEHKDAVKFRDAMFNQEDPVASLGFVDVDAKGMVYSNPPSGNVPYVLNKGSAYKNAIVINGHHYVSPSKIRNYVVPNNLVLANVLEFVNLVKAKQGANGTGLDDRANINEWKSLNDQSYRQLIMYYGMIGSISAAKALIAGDFVEKYRNIVDTKFSEDYVAMVQEVLGNLYADAKIYIDSVGDGGAWISVKDGKLHMKTTDLVPVYDMNSKGNFFGEKQASVQNMVRGIWLDGVFKTEAELIEMGYPVETVSEESFVEGFDREGNVERGDARLIHSLMATQIKNEFDKIREMFEGFGGNLMYDRFKDSPNRSMENMLENEFGLISGQDLISFDKLRNIYKQKDINDLAPRSTDGTVRGAGANEEDGDESIYEKVVSNAQLAGIRTASLTKEHVQVNARTTGLTNEQIFKLITKGRMTSANDVLGR